MHEGKRPLLRNQVSQQVGVQDTELIGPNVNRKAVVISTPKTATVWLSFVGPAAVGTGIALRPMTDALVLADGWMGEALTEEIRAISEAGTETIGVLEIFR